MDPIAFKDLAACRIPLILLIDTNRGRDPLFVCASNVPFMPNNPTRLDTLLCRKLLERRTVRWDD
jgi:hypothetical protein